MTECHFDATTSEMVQMLERLVVEMLQLRELVQVVHE